MNMSNVPISNPSKSNSAPYFTVVRILNIYFSKYFKTIIEEARQAVAEGRAQYIHISLKIQQCNQQVNCNDHDY